MFPPRLTESGSCQNGHEVQLESDRFLMDVITFGARETQNIRGFLTQWRFLHPLESLRPACADILSDTCGNVFWDRTDTLDGKAIISPRRDCFYAVI